MAVFSSGSSISKLISGLLSGPVRIKITRKGIFWLNAPGDSELSFAIRSLADVLDIYSAVILILASVGSPAKYILLPFIKLNFR